jgi:type III secretion system needle length determinant
LPSQGVVLDSIAPAVQPTTQEFGGPTRPQAPLANVQAGDRPAIDPDDFAALASGPNAKPVNPTGVETVKPGAMPTHVETSTPAPVMPEVKPATDKGGGSMSTAETTLQTPPSKDTVGTREAVGVERADAARDTVKDRPVKGESAMQTDSGAKSEQAMKSEAPAKPVDPALEALFKDFAAMAAQMNGMTAPAAPNVEAPVVGAPAQGLEAIDLNELVTRILVNTPERGATEVRMTLQDNVLKGTEISLVRGNDGLLTVCLVTDNPASFQTLVAARNDLQAILQQQEGRPVAVVMLDETEREKNDSRRRSKGLYDAEKERDA